jgi:hypothetical protein
MSEENLPKYKSLLTAQEAADLYIWSKSNGFRSKMTEIFKDIRRNSILGNRRYEVYGEGDILQIVMVELQELNYNAYMQDGKLIVQW